MTMRGDMSAAARAVKRPLVERVADSIGMLAGVIVGAFLWAPILGNEWSWRLAAISVALGLLTAVFHVAIGFTVDVLRLKVVTSMPVTETVRAVWATLVRGAP